MTDRPAIYLFPYLRMRETVQVGPWSLKPLDPAKLATATGGIGATLRALLARHRDDAGVPLTTATFVQRTETERDSDAEREHERHALQAAVAFGVADSNAHDGNEIDWDAPSRSVATAEIASFFVGEVAALDNGTFARMKGGALNRRTVGGGTVHDDFVIVLPPEGLVTIPELKLDGELLEAVYQVTLAGWSDDSLKTNREVVSALHWHSRSWENSPLHTMPDILVQLKTAIEALSGQSGTAAGIPVLESIYRAVAGTLGASQYLWQESAPRTARMFKGKTTTHSAFASWYWNLAQTRNAIVHDTESPVMDYVEAGSPFEGNIFRVAERVTRELIKIRLAQLGYPESCLNMTNRGVLRFAKSHGLGDQVTLISAATS
jgi:hypothetical protein